MTPFRRALAGAGLLVAALAAGPLQAQAQATRPALDDPFLDKLVGRWDVTLRRK